MKFEELTAQHQGFLMYCLFDHIKRKVKKEERDQVIEPNYDEYKDFFNEFDEGYKRYKVAQFYDVTDGEGQNIKIKDLESNLKDFYRKNDILGPTSPLSSMNSEHFIDFEQEFEDVMLGLKKQAIKNARKDIINQKRVKYIRELLGDELGSEEEK